MVHTIHIDFPCSGLCLHSVYAIEEFTLLQTDRYGMPGFLVYLSPHGDGAEHIVVRRQKVLQRSENRDIVAVTKSDET